MMRPSRLTIAALALLAACASAHAASYTMADFDRVEKIDAHLHLHRFSPALLAAAEQARFGMLTINVDYPDFPPIPEQQRVAVALHTVAPTRVAWASTITVDGFEAPGWLAGAERQIDTGQALGAVGVKVWKNIGMSLRGADGKLVMVDDARLAPMFSYLAAQHIPLLGHQGEPHNCWLPLAQMTVKNDRDYFKAHPQYHMALHPEMPSWEDQMAARDRLLAAHPTLQFVGMHMASLERSVDELAAFLDANPKAFVDVAARMGQVQYQSQRDLEKVRNFFIRYQDRLLYGTDLSLGPKDDVAGFVRELRQVWLANWRYFNTADTQRVPELDGGVKGLSLPSEVVDKLYRSNALRAFPTAFRSDANPPPRPQTQP